MYRMILRFFNLRDSSYVMISRGSRILKGTIIGDGTRINGPITIKGRGTCTLGKYCALGADIKIITSNHNSETVNLQYALSKRLGFKAPIGHKKNVIIGSNVWIGDNAIILPGVEIGNGAIIGAGSIVTKNVHKYSITTGVPAKIIKYRFSEDKINKLEQMKWWDMPEDDLKNYPELFSID